MNKLKKNERLIDCEQCKDKCMIKRVAGKKTGTIYNMVTHKDGTQQTFKTIFRQDPQD